MRQTLIYELERQHIWVGLLGYFGDFDNFWRHRADCDRSSDDLSLWGEQRRKVGLEIHRREWYPIQMIEDNTQRSTQLYATDPQLSYWSINQLTNQPQQFVPQLAHLPQPLIIL